MRYTIAEVRQQQLQAGLKHRGIEGYWTHGERQITCVAVL